MKIINEIKKGAIQAITVLSIIGIAGITYAAFNDTINEVTSGSTLQASEYNKLVEKLNAINEKQLATARVNFDGTNCTINGNECHINSNYNINKIVRNSIGNYTIYFSNAFNSMYTISMNSSYYTDTGTYTPVIMSYNVGLNNFSIQSRHSTDLGMYDGKQIYIQIFGGK